jgi:hypothetical protein
MGDSPRDEIVGCGRVHVEWDAVRTKFVCDEEWTLGDDEHLRLEKEAG